MTNRPIECPSIVKLINDLCNGDITADNFAKLDRLLRTDDDSLQLYVEYLDLESELILQTWHEKAGGKTTEIEFNDSRDTGDQDIQVTNLPSIVISPTPPPPSAFGGVFRGAVGYFSQELPLSLLTSTVIMLVAIWLAWACQIPHYQQTADVSPPVPATSVNQEVVLVGQITGLVDCRWGDPSTQYVIGSYVPLGRKFELLFGLMEITYKNGTQVILEGPCTYEVDSSSSGYLKQGKLTANIDTMKRRKAKPHCHNHSRKSTASSLFCVRTPTAIVSDLGTEFGVYVDRSGACEAYVYQGKVEFTIHGDEDGKHAVELRKGDSASVKPGKARLIKVNREPGHPVVSKFVRQMPGLIKLNVYNTGADLQEGGEDPHWQVIARSDDPGFKPRPAVVVPCHESYWLEGDAQSQWISIVPGLVSLPEDVTYTFRTTFRLPRTVPGKTVLHVKFMADDHVDAIRLNGRNLDLPRHAPGEGAYRWFHRLKAQDGFVEGVNVLEVDVMNGGCSSSVPGGSSFMALRVELSGIAYRYGSADSRSEESQKVRDDKQPEDNQNIKQNAAQTNERKSAAFENKTKSTGVEKGGEYFHHASVFGTAAVARENDGSRCENYQRRCVYG